MCARVTALELADPPRPRRMPPELGFPSSKPYRVYAALLELGGRASVRELAVAADLTPKQAGAIASALRGVLQCGPSQARVYVLDA